MSIIYKTTNLINGKIYVGQHHNSADDGYLGSGIYFQTIIKEFGRENFIRETIEYCISTNLNTRETFWIKELDAMNPEVGYNRCVGGQGGWVGKNHPMFGKSHSEESKTKMSKSRFGKKMSKETKLKMSQNNGMKNKQHSEESKIKMRENHANYNGTNHPNFGKHHSIESKIKNSNSHKGMFEGEKHPLNKYYFYCSDGKDYWKDFTATERHSISLKFRRKQTDIINFKKITITRVHKNV